MSDVMTKNRFEKYMHSKLECTIQLLFNVSIVSNNKYS
jgi:hypothetical protein